MIWLILLLGTVLRFISINQSLWLDEATSAMVAKMPLGDIFAKFLPGDFHPPLYYLILKYWVMFFGSSEIELRIPSVFFGILTIYITYSIGKKIFNEKIGLISSLLLATSGLHIYYSQEARMYSLAALLVSLSILLFLNKKWIFFSIVLALIGMTDYVSLLVIPIFLIVGYKDWKKVLISFLPLIIVFAFWLPIFNKQLLSGLALKGSGWWNVLGLPTFKNIALIPVKFILGRISFDNKFIYGTIVIGSIFIYGINILRRPLKDQPYKVIMSWLVIPILIGILLSFKIPTLSYFRFLFCLPAFYLLVVYGIENNIRYRKLFLVLVILINILSTLYYVLNPNFHREDWRSASIALGEDRIIFPSSSQREALIYYGKGKQIISIDQIVKSDKEVWLSRYVWEIFDPADFVRKNLENLGYNKISENNFNGVIFWKYSK